MSNNLVIDLKKKYYRTTLYRFNIYEIYIKEKKTVLDKYNSSISQHLTQIIAALWRFKWALPLL